MDAWSPEPRRSEEEGGRGNCAGESERDEGGGGLLAPAVAAGEGAAAAAAEEEGGAGAALDLPSFFSKRANLREEKGKGGIGNREKWKFGFGWLRERWLWTFDGLVW